MSPTSDGTASAGWAKVGTCASGYYQCVNDHPDTGGTNAAAAKNITNNSRRFFGFGATPADTGVVTSVDVAYYAKENSAGLTGSMDTIQVGMSLYGADDTTVLSAVSTSTALTTSYALYSTTLTPNAMSMGKAAADTLHLKVNQTYAAVGGADTTAQAYVSSIQIVVHYQVAPGDLSQTGYIFENDDQASAANADSDSAQGAGNTAITGVKKGERLNLRTQLKDATAATASDLGLFYDRNDNYWTKVRSSTKPITASGSCSDTNFACTAVAGHYTTAPTQTHVAVDSNGIPWVSFYDTNAHDLIVANYVGIGGSGCGANGSSAWNCETVVSTGDVGKYNNIVVDGAGHAWVAYYDTNGSGEMHVAERLAGSGCASSSWTCSLIDYTALDPSNDQIGMAVDPQGNPRIAYNTSNTNQFSARYVGSGGAGCLNTAWADCTQVDAGTIQEVALAIDGHGNQAMMQSGGGGLYDNRYVGSGGNCAPAVYSCTQVTATAEYPTIAFDPAGTLWAAFHETTSEDIVVAKYVGSGGTGCSTAAWTCTIVDGTVSAHGPRTSLAFDPAGHAWVTYQDTTAGTLRLARYVGSGGTGCESGLTTWTCSTIDSLASKTLGAYSSVAFGPDGTAWISETNATDNDVRVLNLNRAGEILSAPGLSGNANGVSISTSHADMTSVGDTSNKADADCSGGGTFTNGKWFESETGSGVSVAAGNCTEVAFSLDTSQAQSSTTYRFAIATNDATNFSRSFWRGPASTSQIPSLTTEAATTTRYSKDTTPDFANCTATAWGCAVLDTTGDDGRYSSSAFDQAGSQWVAYYENNVDDLRVAHYVGTGGSGCTSSAWTCTTVDSTGDVGSYTSLATAPNGGMYISYYDITNTKVKVAQYVGSSGSGCASSAWTCTTVAPATGWTSIAVDSFGNPWVAYETNSTGPLLVARYVGSGGNCTSTAWTCATIDSTNTPGQHLSIAFDNGGSAWISYYESTNKVLRVAHYVGSGGNCASTAWACITVDATGTYMGYFSSIAIDSSGNPWIAYQDFNNDDLRVAKYVGASGSGCTSSAWTCTTIDSTHLTGNGVSLAFDSTGTAWISYSDDTSNTVNVARYVGASGTGCASTAWTCTAIASTASTLINTSIAFDNSGTPWITYYNSSLALRVAKLHYSPNQPSNAVKYTNRARNAGLGDARYKLDAGLSPRTSTCSATSNYKGYCGVAASDSDDDSMPANANESPLYSFASRSASNASFPSYAWIGQSNTAASTKSVKIEVYRFGTTNAWTTLATNSTTAANTDFTLTGTASAGSAPEYWEADGSNYWTYYRVTQVFNSSAETLKTNAFTAASSNTAPSLPASLAQVTTGNVTITTGNWNNSTSVKFTANVSDADNPDTDYLCVEAQPTNTSFTNTETACGSGVAYSGSAVAASVTLTLTNATQYHWQARTKDTGGLYSSWVAFGGNSDTITAATDVGIDATAPTTGSVFDGSSAGVDATYNSGSLSSLSANWSGFSDANSGLASYDYSIGTTAGATDVLTWTTNASSTSVTSSSLTLHTGQLYFVNVRANDAAGNVSSVVSSNGQWIAPTLTFSVSSSFLSLGHLNAGNSYTSTQTVNLTSSTNAYSGYVVRQSSTSLLTYGSNTIANYAGTYAAPTTWSGTGLGYTSNDTSIQGSGDIFSGATKYAGLASSMPGDIVADHTASVSGTPISSEAFTITYKVAASGTLAAGSYATTVQLSAVATF